MTTGQRLSLDRGWRFHLGDVPFPTITGHRMTYNSAKAGVAWGAAAPDFDDSEWRVLDLPHDWAVEGPFDPEANLSQGYRRRGIAWYRRYIRFEPEDRGRSLELQFDGIATHCTVWINGTIVHRNWCGYTGFTLDLTPFATYGDQQNTIAIRVDADAQEGWWYEGAGIYRHTWLCKRNRVHVKTDGIWANPVRKIDGTWEIPVEITLRNDGTDPAICEVHAELLDPLGNLITHGDTHATTPPLDETISRIDLVIQDPCLWSLETPTLYMIRTTLKREGQPIDQCETTCGFRSFRFDPNHGFFLNDQPVKLKGTCNHQDHAGLGVAVPDAIWDYRIRRLKEMGSNAYRCAHNPPAPEFLDACDRLGMLVMNENRHFNASSEYVRQLEWLVRRDRNHPSVILWSVFNEEPMQGTENGYEMVRRMQSIVERLDPTRPVTAAMNGGTDAPINVSMAVNVVGFNYQQGEYDRFHRENPTLSILSSEDTSSFMTRGIYEASDTLCFADSYDQTPASWGETHRKAWKMIAERPFVAGGFVWTGFDYRGEPQKFSWPSVSSVFGILDTCGFPKSAYYMHQSAWIDDRPVLHLIPHWNWNGREGQPIKVMALTNVESVELFLNGKSLGEKRIDRLEGGEWHVPYTAGRLEAIGKTGGKEVARFSQETTGDPVTLKLIPDRPTLAGDGLDAQPITVLAIDAQGREVPTANLPVGFEMKGPASIIGTGNGDNTSHEPEQTNQRRLFNGLAQVIVQSQRDSDGMACLIAKADGLHSAELQIEIKPSLPLSNVPPTEAITTLSHWLMSLISTAKPDPHVEIGETDMNTWRSIQAGFLQKFAGGAWGAYRASFTPTATIQKQGGWLLFKEIAGAAEIWIDGHSIAKKEQAAPSELKISLAPGTGTRTITVLIDSKNADEAGFSGLVIVTS
jgi:beta-galactosidase